MKRSDIPPVVFSGAPGALIVDATESAVTLFVREDEWGLKKYPRKCSAQCRLGHWEIDGVMVAALVVRIARVDTPTFEHWIDPGHALGVRTLQNLASQKTIDLHVVVDAVARSFRLPNPARVQAGHLVEVVRRRTAWAPENFQAALKRINTLFPTPNDLWHACGERRTRRATRPR